MPNLPQMYALCNARSAYSRPEGEIYSALDEAGFLVFTAVLKEFSGFFLKFDTTTIKLTPGINTYTLPPDLSQLVAISERVTAGENWQPMIPTTLADSLDNIQTLVSWADWSDDFNKGSEFKFYGPYLSAAADESGIETQSINIEPKIDQIRMCQLAYTAKWLPIVNAQSHLMLPNEGTYAMQNFAMADLNRANNDSLSAEYEAKGQRHLTAFLTFVRIRQTVRWPVITRYLDES